MNFIHIADTHIENKTNNIGEDGEKRRHQIIDAFSRLIDYIKHKKIKYLFIAGDFYEHKYIKDSTVDLIIKLFKSIPDTKIFITPGNHDPYITNSVYDRFLFPKNVHIFKEFDVIETEDANIFGFGFTDFDPPKYVNFGNIKPLKNGKKNILIIHTDIYSKKFEYDKEVYKLIQKNFDYVAMGHIHKGNFKKDKKVIYPGSFAELSFKVAKEGTTGAVLGEFKNNNLKLENIHFDNTKYIEHKLDISLENSMSSLILTLNNLNFSDEKIVRIILVGSKKFDINTKFILDNLRNKNIIQIVDNTKLKINIKKYQEEVSLRGIFVKKSIELIEKLNEKKEATSFVEEQLEYDEKAKMVEKAMLLVLEEMEKN